MENSDLNEHVLHINNFQEFKASLNFRGFKLLNQNLPNTWQTNIMSYGDQYCKQISTGVVSVLAC